MDFICIAHFKIQRNLKVVVVIVIKSYKQILHLYTGGL